MIRACDNPFRVDRVHRLDYRSAGFSWSELLARLQRNQGRGAIRGAQGSGKTTLLIELEARLERSGFTVRRLRPSIDQPRRARAQLRAFPRAADDQTALLLDGADRVGFFEWRRLRAAARRAGILVITSHREGRLPTLHRCATTVDLFQELVDELEPMHRLSPTHVAELFERQGGNVRTAFRELYDQYAGRASICARQ